MSIYYYIIIILFIYNAIRATTFAYPANLMKPALPDYHNSSCFKPMHMTLYGQLHTIWYQFFCTTKAFI